MKTLLILVLDVQSCVTVMTSQIPESYDEPTHRPHSSRIVSIIMKNRFRKIIFLGVVSFVIFAAIITTVLLIVFLPRSHSDYFETTTYSNSSATTTKPTENTNCSPKDPTTLFFAYSNDLTPDQVLNTWNAIRNNLHSSNYDIYSYGRLDVNSGCKNHAWSNSIENIEDDIKSDLPNAAESYPSYYFGSNILTCIRYIFESEITVCGTQLFFLVKRLPNDTDVSDLVSSLEKLHISITFVVSEKPSGGMNQQVLYTLATKTNGFCIFAEDDMFQDTPTWLPSFWPSYLVYSVNAEVTEIGTLTLPMFNAPLTGKYYICMTLQDHGGLDAFRMIHFAWHNSESLNSGFLEETLESHADIYGKTTYIRKGPFTLDAVPYNMTLGFEYLDGEIKTLQIRIYSVSAVDFWIPYFN